MEKDIQYYYNFKIDKINCFDNNYYFIYENNNYTLYCYHDNEDKINWYLEIINLLKEKNIYLFKIIKNVYNSYLSTIGNTKYVLIECKNYNDKLSIVDINDFLKKTIVNKENNRVDWSILWQSKIDYIENQLKEINSDYIIEYSVDYFIGITELAISYYNKIKSLLSDNEKMSLSHKRVYYPCIKQDYYNPLSIIIDYEVRDVAEYIKAIFYSNGNPLPELTYYLKVHKLSNLAYNLLFIRLLYPSKYFDEYEKVVNENKSSECLLEIIDRSEEYQMFLKKAYNEISLYANLEKINWLIY